MTTMRPFARWSRLSLVTANAQTLAWVRELLRSFIRRWPGDPPGDRLSLYCEELHSLIELLRKEETRIEQLSAELNLREHWAVTGRGRNVAEEEWTIRRAGDRIRYIRQSRPDRPR